MRTLQVAIIGRSFNIYNGIWQVISVKQIIYALAFI